MATVLVLVAMVLVLALGVMIVMKVLARDGGTSQDDGDKGKHVGFGEGHDVASDRDNEEYGLSTDSDEDNGYGGSTAVMARTMVIMVELMVVAVMQKSFGW